MLKYHDQLLRNIYELNQQASKTKYNEAIHQELLKSAALPARYYELGFKNFTHLRNVAFNDQNTTASDLEYLINNAIKLILKTTYKKMNAPQEFYDFIVETLKKLSLNFLDGHLYLARITLKEAIHYIETKYSWDSQHKQLEQYEQDHPEFVKAYEQFEFYNEQYLDAEYQRIWHEYFSFRKKVRFSASWKFLSLFAILEKQLSVVIAEQLKQL